MSSAVFPALTGIVWPVIRTPFWENTVQTAQSGKETRLANFTYPYYTWELEYDALRQGLVHNTAYTELATLMGFYNARQGSFDSFLFDAGADDNTVTAQAIAVGDGATLAFQLVRALGNFVEPIFAPNVVSAVRVNGVLKTAGVDYTVSAWGSATPGVITFAVAPGNTLAITADFTYYWPCRFMDDNLPFTKWISNMYSAKKITIKSLK